MKYAVLGAGALGSVVGGLMAREGINVALWDINHDHTKSINAHGLQLDLPDGTHSIKVPACRPEEGGEADVILLLTKTLHTKAALASVADRIAQGAAVVSLQNGLGNAERIRDFVPDDQVFYGCTMMPGRFLAPGHVASQGNGKAVFRALTEAGQARAAAMGLNTTGFVLQNDQDGTDAIIWQKAAFNCAMNAITALQGGAIGYLAASDEGVALARETAAEVVAVANALGINADLSAVHAHMTRSLTHHKAHKPSMLQDMEAGRETEIDALCGEVVRQAEAAGVSAPINKTLAGLVRLKTSVLKREAA